MRFRSLVQEEEEEEEEEERSRFSVTLANHSLPMQDMDGLFGMYSIRNGVPYYPTTAAELAAMKAKKKEQEKKKKKKEEEDKIAMVTFNELAAMPMERPSAKQLLVQASNIYLVCCSCQPSAKGINGTLRQKYKDKVAVLRAPDVMELIGPMWQTFPLFYEVRWCELDHIFSLLAPCTYWWLYLCS